MSGSVPFPPPLAHSQTPHFSCLLIGYCTGLSDLYLPAQARPEDVGALLVRSGFPALGHLLTMALPPGTALILALDIPCGDHASLRIARTGASHLEPRSERLAHSLSLTRLLLDITQTYQTDYTVLCLMPHAPQQGALVPLFPSTAHMLAALPDPARIPLPTPGTWDQSLSTSILNAAEVAVALRSAREETGRVLPVLLAENCFLHSLELAHELQEEVTYMAVIGSQAAGGLAQALPRALDPSHAPPDQPGVWLQNLMAQGEPPQDSAPASRVGPGMVMHRVSHLYYLCSQFVTVIQDIWSIERTVQTLFLRCRFNPQDPQNPNRDLFDFMHKIQFEMNRLSWTVLDQIDTVLLRQLQDTMRDILALQRNQPELFLLAGPESGMAKPELPVYLPPGPIYAAYALWQFNTSGWSDFIHLLEDARA